MRYTSLFKMHGKEVYLIIFIYCTIYIIYDYEKRSNVVSETERLKYIVL